MKKLMLALALIIVLLTACESPDYVTDAKLIQDVSVPKIGTEFCGKGCTDYMVTFMKDEVKTKYETTSDVYNALDEYRDALKKVNGNTDATYDIIVSPSEKFITGIAPTKNR